MDLVNYPKVELPYERRGVVTAIEFKELVTTKISTKELCACPEVCGAIM